MKQETHSGKLSEIDNKQKEDLDLGVLFNLIRTLLNNLVKSIVWIFKSLFEFLISILIYLKKHSLKLIIAAVIGASIGAIHQIYFKEKVYTSSMTVQANYRSIVQLYKDIEYCAGLIEEKDFSSLATFFNVDLAEAESIKYIAVQPYTNQNQIILAYNDFISKLDTNVIKNADFDKFSKNIPKEEFHYHIVEVESTSRTLFSKLEKPIINSIAQNPYYAKMKQTEITNLRSQEHVLNISMIELDSLRQFYKEIAINESKKPMGASNFYLGNKETDNREIVVFDKYIKANIDLVEVRSEMNLKNEIINVVSSFNLSGSAVKGLFRNSFILGALGGILLVFMYLFAVELNKYLLNFERENK